jgi:hypothetical protein
LPSDIRPLRRQHNKRATSARARVGKRIGRPRILTYWEEIAVTQECENRLRQLAERNAQARLLKARPYIKELRALQKPAWKALDEDRLLARPAWQALWKIDDRGTRNKAAKQVIKEVLASRADHIECVGKVVEAILPKRRKCRKEGCPSPIKGCGKLECSPRFSSVELKQPKGYLAAIEKAVALKWGIDQRHVQTCKARYRRALRKLREAPDCATMNCPLYGAWPRARQC